MKSDIEQSYIADIISSRYPTSEPEGIVEVGELTREPAQFSATATKQDGGVGFVQGAAPAPMSSSATAPTTGRVFPEDTASIQNIPRTQLEEMMGNIGSAIQTGAEYLDFAVIGLPDVGTLSLKDLTVGDLGKVMEAMSYGFTPTTGEGQTLRPTPEALDLLNAIPAFQAANKAIKYGVKGLKAGAEALAPAAADVIESGLRKTGMIMDIVEPSKFNPKTELPKAIEFVASTPETKVYLPLANRAPSVALRLAKPEIKGTGKKDALTVQDIGIVLEKSQLNLNNGIPLDPTNPKDLVKMVDSATAEAQYQLSQPISGANWYEDDVAKAFVLGSKVVPQLATDEPLRVMATVFAASTSYNKRAGENWSVAMRITEDLMKTGRVASRNPENGKLWGGTTGPIMEQQLKFHQFMIDKMGMDKYAEWLLTPHSVKEISNMRAESGLYKSPKIDGKANDMKMGSFAIGEKGGAFFLNLNGIKETTADKWFSRTFNRQSGNLTTGAVSEQGLVDAPRNESERAIMKTWNRAVAENLKLDEQANQAVLWYYEQSLYYSMGIKSAKSESFSDGAKNLLNSRGIPFSESELTGVRSKGNALKASEEQRSAAANGDTTSLGNSDAVKPATEKAKRVIKRSQSAPLKGAE
jgi:hypothetical protein